MLRNIKCRGKLKSDPKTWVEGAYYKHQKVTLCPIGISDQDIKDNEVHLMIKGGFSDWNMPAGLNCYEVLPDTVGLGANLPDKNGKELFEGDLFRLSADDILYEIVWQGTALMGKQINSEIYIGLAECQSDIELVGNVVDTPELLLK